MNSSGQRPFRTDQFAERDANPRMRSRYSAFNPGALYLLHQRERALARLLRDESLLPLANKRILEIGCGTGGELLSLMRLGATPHNLVGIDVSEERLAAARERLPGYEFLCANAAQLPFVDQSFDLVGQFTAFTSMPNPEMRTRAAAEALRVLKRGGSLIWYDFFLPSRDRSTVPLGLAQIRELFPGARLQARRVTLLPPLARLLAAHLWEVALLIERLPLLRSHYLVIVRPSAGSKG